MRLPLSERFGRLIFLLGNKISIILVVSTKKIWFDDKSEARNHQSGYEFVDFVIISTYKLHNNYKSQRWTYTYYDYNLFVVKPFTRLKRCCFEYV